MGLLGGHDVQRAERLYACAKVVGESFLADVARRRLISKHEAVIEVILHPPDPAMHLGYVIVASAYRLKDGARPRALVLFREWFREILARQQLAHHSRIANRILQTIRGADGKTLPYTPPGPSELDPMRSLIGLLSAKAEQSIERVMAAVRANEPHPLAPAYAELVPCFGGPADGDELEKRYGDLLMRLFLEARNAVAKI